MAKLSVVVVSFKLVMVTFTVVTTTTTTTICLPNINLPPEQTTFSKLSEIISSTCKWRQLTGHLPFRLSPACLPSDQIEFSSKVTKLINLVVLRATVTFTLRSRSTLTTPDWTVNSNPKRLFSLLDYLHLAGQTARLIIRKATIIIYVSLSFWSQPNTST